MKAKVTHEFRGCRDGDPIVRTIAVGDIVEGDLAAVAVREKWADELTDDDDDTAEIKLLKAQQAVDAAQAAFDGTKVALDAAEEAKKPAAQKKYDAAEIKLKAAQAKLEKLTKE